MANLRPTEILLILLVVLVLFGAKRLPDLAKSVGKSMKILKDEVKDLRDENEPSKPVVPVVPVVPVIPATDAGPVLLPVTDVAPPTQAHSASDVDGRSA